MVVVPRAARASLPGAFRAGSGPVAGKWHLRTHEVGGHGGRSSHLHARDTGRSPTAFKVQGPDGAAHMPPERKNMRLLCVMSAPVARVKAVTRECCHKRDGDAGCHYPFNSLQISARRFIPRFWSTADFVLFFLRARS